MRSPRSLATIATTTRSLFLLALSMAPLAGCQAPGAVPERGDPTAGVLPTGRDDALGGPWRTVDLPQSAALDAPGPLPEASPPTGWRIQFGAFQREPNARRRAEEAARYEPSAAVVLVTREDRTLWCVRSRAYSSREAAAASLRALVAAGGVGEVCLVAP